MKTVTLPEQYSEQIKTIAGYPIRVTSYRLWDTFYAKTEVAPDGMGGWFASAEGSTQARAEARVIAEAESTCETAIGDCLRRRWGKIARGSS